MNSYKLIKNDGYWIIVSNEDIKVGNLFAHFFTDGFIGIGNATILTLNDYPRYKDKWFSLIASQNSEHNLPNITFSDEVAKELGIVDGLSAYFDYHNWSEEERKIESIIRMAKESEFLQGYNQALSDNKDKLFTGKQIVEAIAFGFGICKKHDRAPFDLEQKEFIQSLTKQEYDIEIEIENNLVKVNSFK